MAGHVHALALSKYVHYNLFNVVMEWMLKFWFISDEPIKAIPGMQHSDAVVIGDCDGLAMATLD